MRRVDPNQLELFPNEGHEPAYAHTNTRLGGLDPRHPEIVALRSAGDVWTMRYRSEEILIPQELN